MKVDATLSTSLFDYDLPEELIAQRPAERRDGSRMLVVDRVSGAAEIHPFRDVVDYLAPDDVLVCNDTRVLRGRMYARRDGLSGGARFELLLVAPSDPSGRRWSALLKPGRRAAPGTRAVLLKHDGALNDDGDGFSVLGRRDGDLFEIEFFQGDPEALQRRYGHVPLPPYIRRGDECADSERYQTVFARHPGAVAAPTAGLHFTPEILEELRGRGVRIAMVTLHVGPGTFKPVSVENIRLHRMHAEEYHLPEETASVINEAHARGKRVMAVGTTTVRVLESCARDDGSVVPGSGRTELFLHPPRRPKAVDRLLTNFHLPRSTLLMLVSTFADREKVLAAYALAVRERMRFYSYGDCMLLK